MLRTINLQCSLLPKPFSPAALGWENEERGALVQGWVKRQLQRNQRTLARERFKTDNMMRGVQLNLRRH